MCPEAFCEDHLPANACIVGHNARYEALGCIHPKQGCYVFCSAECVQFAHSQGLATEEIIQATAAMVLGTTGMDLTKAPVPAPVYETDTRTSLEKLTEREHSQLLLALRAPRVPVSKALPDLASNMEKLSGQRVSTFDLLHDLVFDSDRLTTNNKDTSKAAHISDLEQLLAWEGAPDTDDMSEEEAAAEMYITLAQRLTQQRGADVRRAAVALGVCKLGVRGKLKTVSADAGGAPLKLICHAMALFFTRPSAYSLIFCEKANEMKAQNASAAKRKKKGKEPAVHEYAGSLCGAIQAGRAASGYVQHPTGGFISLNLALSSAKKEGNKAAKKERKLAAPSEVTRGKAEAALEAVWSMVSRVEKPLMLKQAVAPPVAKKQKTSVAPGALCSPEETGRSLASRAPTSLLRRHSVSPNQRESPLKRGSATTPGSQKRTQKAGPSPTAPKRAGQRKGPGVSPEQFGKDKSPSRQSPRRSPAVDCYKPASGRLNPGSPMEGLAQKRTFQAMESTVPAALRQH